MYVARKEVLFTMDTRGNQAPKIATGFLGFFALIAFLMPFVVFGLMISAGKGMKLGYLLSSIVFFGAGYYLFRMVSWNRSGSEAITVFEDEVMYQAKTKWFTLETHILQLKGCVLLIADENNETANYAVRNGEQVVEMKFRANLSDLQELDDILSERNEL